MQNQNNRVRVDFSNPEPAPTRSALAIEDNSTSDSRNNNNVSSAVHPGSDEARDNAFYTLHDSTKISLTNGTNSNVISATTTQPSSGSTMQRSYWRADINPAWTDVLLVICAFVSGLVDGLSFNAWGSFSSMQTGNCVFIALGVSGQPVNPAYRWAKSLIAFAVFIISNLLFITVSRALGPRRRTTLLLSFTTQTLALLAAALLIQLRAVSDEPEDPRAPIEWIQVVPIALLAFQAAGQIVTSRVLAFDEIPTVVLTTLLCDLLVDPRLWAKGWGSNGKRNRRVGCFLALFLGAMTAGGLTKVTHMAANVWLAMGLKGVVTGCFLVWGNERGECSKKGVEEG